ncbi:hypothetical protein B0H11DRAFT_898292 [Mycena galericulata]|nr:hypothetical protein B0H11DRAFT_898292 [Mycena galericulata]
MLLRVEAPPRSHARSERSRYGFGGKRGSAHSGAGACGNFGGEGDGRWWCNKRRAAATDPARQSQQYAMWHSSLRAVRAPGVVGLVAVVATTRNGHGRDTREQEVERETAGEAVGDGEMFVPPTPTVSGRRTQNTIEHGIGRAHPRITSNLAPTPVRHRMLTCLRRAARAPSSSASPSTNLLPSSTLTHFSRGFTRLPPPHPANNSRRRFAHAQER